MALISDFVVEGARDGRSVAELMSAGGQVLTLFGSGIPPEGRALEAGIIFLPNPETGESFQTYDTFCTGGGPGSDGSGSIDCLIEQGHRFNYNDIPSGVSLINENRNLNFSAVGEYELDGGVTAYVNANLSHREGRLNFTPLPVQGAAGRFTDLIQVPFTNPNIPADALTVIQDARAATCAALLRCASGFRSNSSSDASRAGTSRKSSKQAWSRPALLWSGPVKRRARHRRRYVSSARHRS